MDNKRIMIIGCGGSGKSTLANELGKVTSIPVIHLDKLKWRPGWVSISKDEFDTLLHNEIVKGTWIIDGNYKRTIGERLHYCDTVIFLNFSRLVCLYSAIKRVIMYHGKTRPDMGAGCPEKIDWEFVTWIWNFNKNNRRKYLNLLSNVKDKDVYILHKRKECKDLIEHFKTNKNL